MVTRSGGGKILILILINLDRHIIKNSGGNHVIGSDYDGDGQPELVSWNQGEKLLLFEIQTIREIRMNGKAGIFAGIRRNGRFPSIPVDIDFG